MLLVSTMSVSERIASFSVSPPAPVAGFATVFDASESVCTLGPCHYNWVDDADNSSLGTGQIISFTFRGVGVKFVHLTITDSLGRTASVERDVMANPNTPPPPPLPGGVPLTYYISNTGSDSNPGTSQLTS